MPRYEPDAGVAGYRSTLTDHSASATSA